MIKHFVILSSSYSLGTRIALHYTLDVQMNIEVLNNAVRTIKESCGETVSISTHYIETDADDWKSIVEQDGFFDDVKVIDNLEEFVELILKDRVLNGIDIAKYILATQQCTHLELEKLVYMCYADYLCATHEKLFKDKIYAFKYGPVIESVYEAYKGKKFIETGTARNKQIENAYAKMPARSRILFAEDGIKKIEHINMTLKRCCGLTATELVNITHVVDGPWASIENDGPYAEISDDVILEKHFREVALIKL